MQKLTHDAKFNRNQIYKKLIEMKQTGGHLTEFELDAFINYFAPAVPKTPKTAFEWVAKAVAESDIRKYLNFVFVQDGVAVATDGARVHFANVDMPNGYYDAKTGLAVEDKGRYPDWRRIIPRDGVAKPSEKWESRTTSTNKKPEFVTLIDNRSFLTKYLDEALAARENVLITDDGLFSKVTGQNQFGTFVVACRRD